MSAPIASQPTRACLALGALAFALTATIPALAQPRVPSRVRLVHPSCEGAIAWGPLTEALRVELRTMGSDLADDSGAPARLVIDAVCDTAVSRVVVVLLHGESGRAVREEIVVTSGEDRTRTLALNLSELILARWLALATPQEVAVPAPAIDLSQLREELRAELRAEISAEVHAEVERAQPPRVELTPPPRTPPSTQGTFADLALSVSMYPAATSALGELRAGVSMPIGAHLSLGLEAIGGGGWTGDPLGDVALAIAGGAAALRMRRAENTWSIEAGPRIDVGYVYARGIPHGSAIGATLDAAYFALSAEARFRVRLGRAPWLLLGMELGAALAGIDARADDRRVTAQLGVRIALLLGVSWTI